MQNSSELDISVGSSSIIESSGTWNRAEVNSYSDLTNRPTIRVLALIEGSTVSGPAKNLFEFCRVARTLSTGPVVDIAVVTFQRSLALDCSRNTDLIDAARPADMAI